MRKIKDSTFAFLSALVGTVLAYGIFVGQYFFSNIVTLGIYADTCIETYPMFIKLGRMLRYNLYSGIDVDVFNGAAEQFYKIFIGKNPIVVLFAWLGSYTDTRMAYVAMFAFFLFLFLYCGQRLLVKFFSATKLQAVLAMCSAMFIFICSSDFSAFTSVASMSIIGLYVSFEFANKPSVSRLIFSSIVYVILFTSGAPIYECICALCIAVITFIYVQAKYKERIFKALYRAWGPGVLGGLVSFLNLLNFYKYTMEDSVATGVINMRNAIEFTFKSSDLLGTLFFSYNKTSGFERQDYYTLGVIWIVAAIIFVNNKLYKKLSKEEKNIGIFVLILNAFILLCAMGKTTPFGTWLFSFVPGFGAEHLPIRFAMFSMPLLFVVFGFCYKYMPDKENRILITIGWSLLGCAVFVMLKGETLSLLSKFNINRLILELLIIGLIIVIIGKNGWCHKKTVIMSIFYVCTFSYAYFCDYSSVSASTIDTTQYSIVHNEWALNTLNNYINGLEEKQTYRYAYINSNESVPVFVPSNFSWYNLTDRKISGYLGYPLHEYISKDYLWDTLGSSFYNFDWGYLLDTRADFIITDDVTIAANSELYSKVINWNKPIINLWGTLNIYTLNKFVPEYYTEIQELSVNDYVLDENNSLDDGYFYSADLSNDDIVESSSNGANEFSITINCESDSLVEFLPFVNKYFKYYVDGEKYMPDIQNGQTFFRLTSGIHQIQINYDNIVERINIFIFATYYLIWMVALLVSVFIKVRYR